MAGSKIDYFSLVEMRKILSSLTAAIVIGASLAITATATKAELEFSPNYDKFIPIWAFNYCRYTLGHASLNQSVLDMRRDALSSNISIKETQIFSMLPNFQNDLKTTIRHFGGCQGIMRLYESIFLNQ